MYKTLHQRFKEVRDTHFGDYINLSKAVRGMKYKIMEIQVAFNKYVPKTDYDKEEIGGLLQNLVHISSKSTA